MEGLPSNYRDNITVDNGVEIVWVNQKGQVIQGGKQASQDVIDDEVVVGMPRVPSFPVEQLPPTSPGGTHRKSVSGTVHSPQLIGTWFTSATDGAPPKSPGPPETEEDDADPGGHPCMALEPYASECYNSERKGLLGKKRTPMETLLSWKGKQITSPLTIACRENKTAASESVAAFGSIMGYMGDRKVKDPGMQLLRSLQMRMLEGSQEFRDEIFCQVLWVVSVVLRGACLLCSSQPEWLLSPLHLSWYVNRELVSVCIHPRQMLAATKRDKSPSAVVSCDTRHQI